MWRPHDVIHGRWDHLSHDMKGIVDGSHGKTVYEPPQRPVRFHGERQMGPFPNLDVGRGHPREPHRCIGSRVDHVEPSVDAVVAIQHVDLLVLHLDGMPDRVGRSCDPEEDSRAVDGGRPLGLAGHIVGGENDGREDQLFPILSAHALPGDFGGSHGGYVGHVLSPVYIYGGIFLGGGPEIDPHAHGVGFSLSQVQDGTGMFRRGRIVVVGTGTVVEEVFVRTIPPCGFGGGEHLHVVGDGGDEEVGKDPERLSGGIVGTRKDGEIGNVVGVVDLEDIFVIDIVGSGVFGSVGAGVVPWAVIDGCCWYFGGEKERCVIIWTFLLVTIVAEVHWFIFVFCLWCRFMNCICIGCTHSLLLNFHVFGGPC
mmetsp:Transcript_11120/g.24549  ORF Transcript_11120/g.24549 Transcript_11120/m.24549 type:complete len:367 (+) Transcript_11120:2806-3906(+)